MAGDYVLSCVKGINADLFPHILKLYVPEGSVVLDATYGLGAFWIWGNRSALIPFTQLRT